ncbi:hypothetical protein Avbf_10443 [Armadillidium vulgare]|nr:hypothetical protein Avbf_10443 [Armadillidium vulgare]
MFSLTVSVTFFLLFSYYSSFLTSSLAFVSLKLPFRNLQELYAKSDDYKISTIRGSSTVDMLKTSPSTTIKNVWDKMKYSKEEEFPSSVETLYTLVASKKVTGILGTEKVTLLENYDFVAFSLPLKLMSSWAVPKGFPLKEILNYQ